MSPVLEPKVCLAADLANPWQYSGKPLCGSYSDSVTVAPHRFDLAELCPDCVALWNAKHPGSRIAT